MSKLLRSTIQFVYIIYIYLVLKHDQLWNTDDFNIDPETEQNIMRYMHKYIFKINIFFNRLVRINNITSL